MSGNSTELLRKLAAEAAQMKDLSGPKGEKKEEKEKKPNSEYNITLYEYPDLIITRTTPRTKKHLILMPSAGAAFIKTEEKGRESSELLNPKNYAAFTEKMKDIILPEDFWIKNLTRGSVTGAQLMNIFQDKTILEMLRKKAFPKNVDLLNNNMANDYSIENKVWTKAYSLFPHLFMENRDNEKTLKCLLLEPVFAKSIVEMFGLENARDFFHTYEESLVVFSAGYTEYYRYGIRRSSDWLSRGVYNVEDWEMIDKDKLGGGAEVSIIPYTKMDYRSFKEFVLYDSFRMGYGANIRQFFEEWKDTLNLQMQLYGKIRNKYPVDMPLFHNQLSYKVSVLQKGIDKNKFEKTVKRAMMYEGSDDKYVYVAPKSRQDFLDEATMQCNCIAGYIPAFTEGRSIIIFMRKKMSPGRSYITVEISPDGKVNQAKLARNREPSEAEKTALYKWTEKCGRKAAEERAA